VLLPLLVATVLAYGFTVLALRRSILTEKVSRRGFHLSGEYAVDPLEVLFAREVVRTNVVALSASATRAELALRAGAGPRQQRLYPVVDAEDRLMGVAERRRAEEWAAEERPERPDEPLLAIANVAPVVAHPDEPLRVVVYRMAETGLTRFPVVERGADRRFLGMLSLTDLLKARQRNLEAERRRERVLTLPFAFPRRAAPVTAVAAGDDAETRNSEPTGRRR
jgi:CBS domain-containing protein